MSTRLAFMIGTGRCGSTLLADLFCRRPGTGFISNYENRFGRDLPRSGSIYRASPPRLRRQRWMAHPSEAYDLLAREVSPMLVAPHRDLVAADASPFISRRLEATFGSRIGRHGGDVFLHKLTGWPRARMLAHTFPEAKFIHVYRDGRAVANSLVQQDWWSGFHGPDKWDYGRLTPGARDLYEASGESYVVLAALQWSILMNAYTVSRQQLASGKWLDVRYEAFVAEPRRETERMCQFLDIPMTDDFLDEVAAIGVHQRRASAHQVDLDPETVDLMNKAMASELVEYGYTT